MNVPSTIFLIASGLCILMPLVLVSLLRSRLQGIREWCMANVIAFVAYILYALDSELPPILAYEAANAIEAHALVAFLANEGVEARVLGEALQGAFGGIEAVRQNRA